MKGRLLTKEILLEFVNHKSVINTMHTNSYLLYIFEFLYLLRFSDIISNIFVGEFAKYRN